MTDLDIMHLYRQAFAIAAARGVPEGDRADVVQDAVLKIWVKRGLFHGKSKPETWTHRVIQNCVTDYFRKVRQRRHECYNLSRFRQVRTPVTYQDHSEFEFADLLSQMPDRYRQVLLLYRYHRMRMGEVAEVMGCSYAAAWDICKRACKKLERVLI